MKRRRISDAELATRDAAWRARYEAGESAEAIARSLGVYSSSVNAAIRRAGGTLRDYNTANAERRAGAENTAPRARRSREAIRREREAHWRAVFAALPPLVVRNSFCRAHHVDASVADRWARHFGYVFAPSPNRFDLIGQRFGSLLVDGHASPRHQKKCWVCRCDCGSLTVATTADLRGHYKKSCGCSSQKWRGFEEELTYELAKELFDYDPETGALTWRRDLHEKHRLVRRHPGEIVGSNRHPDGYWRICVGGRTYASHRVAFLLMTGRWPSEEIDHINLDRGDNRWCNLREATRSQNARNKRSRGASGFKGVSWHRQSRKWRAAITVDHKRIHLGDFVTKEAAAEAYRVGAIEYHGEFANLSSASKPNP